MAERAARSFRSLRTSIRREVTTDPDQVRALEVAGRARPSYQSIVARRPSSNDVRASKPKRSRARLVSSARRGWPSGLVASQRISPSKPVSSDDQLDQLADRDLPPDAEVDRLRAVVALGGEDDPLGGVVDVEELARRAARAPDLDVVVARARARRRTS